MEEGDVTEEDEDDEDGIRFVTLESRFENKETVLSPGQTAHDSR